MWFHPSSINYRSAKLYSVLEPKEHHAYINLYSKPINQDSFSTAWTKKETKYSSHERTDIFKEVKTRKQIEVLRCSEWYKSRLVSKHTLPKDPFLHTTLIKERKRHFPLHWLFVFDRHLYLLVHSFLPMAFMREMSFGSLAFSLSPVFE